MLWRYIELWDLDISVKDAGLDAFLQKAAVKRHVDKLVTQLAEFDAVMKHLQRDDKIICTTPA